MKKTFLLVLIILTVKNLIAKDVEFKPHLWSINDPEGGLITTYMGRKSLFLYQGFAFLKGLLLTDGTIEVDFNAHGNRGFAGIVFRSKNKESHELVYLRCHLSNKPNAIQYAPRFNGVMGWQLYSNKGHIANTEIPHNRWIHLKLEVKGKKAFFYVNDSSEPDLIITDLKQKVSEGEIGLWALNGPGHFSNFSYTKTDPEPVEVELNQIKPINPNFIDRWKLSNVFKEGDLNIDQIDNDFLKKLDWVDVVTDQNGMLDISKYRKKITQIHSSPVKNGWDDVIALSTITSNKKRTINLSFGYSDKIKIVVNGKLMFQGNNSFRSKSPRFLGIVGVNNETLTIPLVKGENQILFVVTEQFGGWGFITKFEK
ncbi:MAG: hypothetical protein D8M58_17745 [Calditrichaeota bacterium]|nr:MAG: hypothetical protein DWQ03_01660 [Calditrichota bacterium]MBL1207251.1 hypothetical protein [Calditrichota bacterium]NOG47084.1 hypothetical protein [Calditrichota bacterium]